jgi:hypothetical protein
MSETRHLTEAQLVRALDGEVTVIEQAEIDEHLVRCEACLERYEALAEFSSEIETAINATAVRPPRDARERLVDAMQANRKIVAARPRGLGHAWWWAAAAAAVLAVAFIALRGPEPAPKQEIAKTQEPASKVEQSVVGQGRALRRVPRPALQISNNFAAARPRGARRPKARSTNAAEASASGFMRLPYADAAQPMQTAGLVRVRMQLSMLARAGVIQMSPGAPDAPVEADLLLGIDGQPYAVRLVSANK